MEARKITRKDGIKYTVRNDRSRYFFPEEWLKFIATQKKGVHMFDTLINTGARIREIMYIKPTDFDFERNTLTLRVTKIKAKKGEKYGRARTFKVSSQYARRMRNYIKRRRKEGNECLFNVSNQAAWQMFRRGLKKAGFEDYWNFGLHNIRKTHGNWLKAMEIPAEEICLRLGHDFNTYLRHYGSATIFDRKDKQLIQKILGDLYGIK